MCHALVPLCYWTSGCIYVYIHEPNGGVNVLLLSATCCFMQSCIQDCNPGLLSQEYATGGTKVLLSLFPMKHKRQWRQKKMKIVQFHTLWNVVLRIVCAPTTVIYAPLLCTITGLVFTEWFIYSECIFFAWRFSRKASLYLNCLGYNKYRNS